MSCMRIFIAIVLTGLALPAEGNIAIADDTSAVPNAQFARDRNAEIDASIAHVDAEKTAEFEHARNEEIETALAEYRRAVFNRDRNDEINASLAAVAAERTREAQAAIEAEFERQQNAMVEASTVRVAAVQLAEFEEERNREINAAMAASQDAKFAEARNAEIEASVAAVEQTRQESEFAAARNAEIEISLSTVNARLHPIETGSIARSADSQ
jgi:hypothetical protein